MSQIQKKSLTFVVGETGSQTSLETIYNTVEEFYNDDPPANRIWTEVTVADEAARDEWIEAKNEWLRAAWTPNQTQDERKENANIMREAEEVMRRLEM